MYVSVLIILAALITFVVGNASHAQRADIVRELSNLTNSTNLTSSPDSSLPNLASTFDQSGQGLLGPETAWAEAPPAPADEATWKKAVCKGTKMMAQMSYSDADVAALLPVPKDTVKSKWTFDDLFIWGYEMYNAPKDYWDFAPGGFWGISNVLRSLGITDKCGKEKGEWWALSILHYDPDQDQIIAPVSQEYEDPYGDKRRVTGAKFFMSVLPGVGIVAQNRKSPWEALKELHPTDASPSELPEMQRSSDMMWAMWEHKVPEDQRHKIEFFMSLSIMNPLTMSLIRHALDDAEAELTTDAVEFKTTTPQGKALLSSPNGAGFAHFLIERKEQVGLKTIDTILVFQCESKAKGPCMMFGVQDLAAPAPRPKDDTAPKDPAAGPSGSDPNENKMTEDIEMLDAVPPDDEKFGNKETRGLAKGNFVRLHTFSLDEHGNVTLSSSNHYIGVTGRT